MSTRKEIYPPARFAATRARLLQQHAHPRRLCFQLALIACTHVTSDKSSISALLDMCHYRHGSK